MKFRFKGRELTCGKKLFLAGVVNVTPDSFSDGSLYLSKDAAVSHGIELLDAGADMIDIGGESTRPGAKTVSADIEIKRVLPVVSGIRKLRPSAVLSVDTMKSEVAEAVLSAGADIINDVSGLRNSQKMAATVAKFDAGLILMHMRGTPGTMQKNLDYPDLIGEIFTFLGDAIQKALDAGVGMDNIAIDPGIGFGKSAAQNLEILSKIREFKKLKRPLYVGPSRKSFIGTLLNEPDAAKRIWGTAGAVAWLAMAGVDFARVHDVREMRQMLNVIDAIRY